MKKSEQLTAVAVNLVQAEERGDTVSVEYWTRVFDRALRDDNRIPTYWSETLGQYVTVPEE